MIGENSYIDWTDLINCLEKLYIANPSYTGLDVFIEGMREKYDLFYRDVEK